MREWTSAVRRSAKIAMLGGAALMAVTQAEAATYIVTYTGTVSGSYDQTGEFGSVGPGRYDGMSFTSIYTLTAPLPGANTFHDGTQAAVWGGSQSGVPSPVSATLTINGITRTFAGDYSGRAYQRNACCGGDRDQVRHEAASFLNSAQDYRNIYVYNDISSLVNDFLFTQDYTAPLSYTFQSGDISTGYFFINDTSDGGTTINRFAYGNVVPTSVTIALASAVPEPATWMLMILGFGTIGYAMRRRRGALDPQFKPEVVQ